MPHCNSGNPPWYCGEVFAPDASFRSHGIHVVHETEALNDPSNDAAPFIPGRCVAVKLSDGDRTAVDAGHRQAKEILRRYPRYYFLG